MQQIRVLVVEDSIVFRDLLVKSLNRDPDITVVAAARDPYEARDAILTYKPDVMTLDIELPRMDGIEFLRKLMPQYPLPVVMISSLSEKVFEALEAGAVDFVCKGDLGDHEATEEFLTNELPEKINVASQAKIGNIAKVAKLKESTRIIPQGAKPKIIAIGASTGGTEAIYAVVQQLPADIPGGVVVQHMPKGFTKMFAQRVDEHARCSFKEAEDGDRIIPGRLLLAPGGDRQLKVVQDGTGYKVSIKEGPKVNGHCPSVDVMFDSVAQVAGDRAVGVILTGMGGDGAKGLLSMRKAGAQTIGEDEASCIVYGMPMVAYNMGAVMYQESLENIPKRMMECINAIK